MLIVDKIPKKEPTMLPVPKGKPVIETLLDKKGKKHRTIEYPEKKMYVPTSLQSGFYRLCEIDSIDRRSLSDDDLELRVEAATQRKDIFLRFAGEKPLAALSAKYSEFSIEPVAEVMERITGTSPIIRYSPQQERVQLFFPITNSFHQLHMFVDSGDFGVYGGSGSCAARYGLGWDNGEFSAMTMFLYEELSKSKGRIIHLKGKTMEHRIKSILSSADKVEASAQQAKTKMFTRDEIIEYATAYKPELTEKITMPLIMGLREEVSAYDLSCKLTRLMKPQTPDHVRLRVEYMAGEVILCYEEIKKNLYAKAEETRLKYEERLKQWGF